MSDNFDPYYKWLGIKPKDQPPNHYRLLGVELFETDTDVIDNAADQRMRHIRSLQTGANAAVSQRILNEIAAARVCLTDPDRRTEYDAQLPTQPVRPPAAPPAPPVFVTAVPPIASAAPPKSIAEPPLPREIERPAILDAPPAPRPTPNRRRAPAKDNSPLPMGLMVLIAGLAIAVVVVVGLTLLLRSSGISESRPQVDTGQIGSQPRPAPGPAATTGSASPPKRVPPTGQLKLAPIAPVRLERGQNLHVRAAVRDPAHWTDHVTFAVGLGTPSDVRLDPKSGLLQWDPPRNAQRTYRFNIEAHAGASEDSTSFQVDLPWGRGELVFKGPGRQTAYAGEPLVVNLYAADDDGPAQGVQFRLLSGPVGATIDQQSRQLRWHPGPDQLGKKHQVSIRATDDRNVSADASLTIFVEEKPKTPASDGESSPAKGNSDKPSRLPKVERLKFR